MQKNILGLALSLLVLAGCATSSSYVQYTPERFPPKDPYFTVNVYAQGQSLAAGSVYYVIGRVSVEGFASSGVSPETLMNQARKIARARGADAIINSRTMVFHYYNGDALLRFKGELIVYAPAK